MTRSLTHIGRLFVIGVLCFALTFMPGVAPAYADAISDAQAKVDASTAKLEDAEAKLEELGTKVMEAGEYLQEIQYSLEQTRQQIDETQQKIDEKEAELDEDQELLGKQMVDEYKNGGLSLVSVLVNSTTFKDFFDNLYYLTKVEERSSEVIDEVNRVKTELDEQKADLSQLETEQQDLVDQQTEQMQVLQEQQAEQQNYVDNLSAEVQAALEEKRQAELEEQRRQAEEAKRQAELAAQEAQAQQRSGGTTSSGGSSYNSGIQAPSVSGSGGGLSAAQRQTIINAAYSQIGVPYSYGACSPGVAFDCSGFTSWCYAQAGISIPHSASAQAYGMTRVSPANAQPGDLIIWLGGMNPLSGNHAALYLGNGLMINANWSGVVVESIWSRGPDAWGYYG